MYSSAFLYQCIESFVFLEDANRGGGAIAPLAPLNQPLTISACVTHDNSRQAKMKT